MARRLEIEIIGNSRSFERALGRAQGSAGRFGRVARRALLAGGAAVATGLGLSTKAAIDFESSFAGVRKTVDGTEAQMQKLSDGIRDMAKEIPTSVNALNEIAASAGQLGIRREAILGFTRVIADLGETTNLVGEEGSAALARFANITQMSQKDFDRLGSTIVALGNAGASTESEIIEMGLRIAAAGKQVGISEPKILGLANALSSVGIEAEAGGTAISRVMIDIEKSVRSGGEKLEGFARVAGMSSAKFKLAWERDAAGALVTFIEGLGKLGEEGGNIFKVLDKLGFSNVRVRDTLLRAAGAGDLLRESLKLGASAWEKNTALTEEAAKRYETTASQLGILKNNLIDVGISIGERLLPMLSRGARALTGLLEKIRDADGLKAKISIVFAGVRGAAGDLIDVLRDALLGATKRTPLKLDSGKIIEWKTTRQIGLVKSIQDGLRGVDWTAIGKQVGEGISKRVQITADFIKTALATASAFIDAHADEFAELGAKMLLKIMSKLLDPAFWVRNWQLVLGVAIAVFPITRLASLGVRAAGAILSPLRKLLPAGFQNIGFRATQAILGVLGKLPGLVQRIFLSVVSGALNALGRLVGFIRGNLQNVLGRIPGWIKAAFRLTFFLSFVNALQAGWARVRDATKAAIDFIRRQLDRVPGAIRAAFSLNPISAMINQIQGLIGWIKTLIGWIRSIPSLPGGGRAPGQSFRPGGVAGPGSNAMGTNNWRGGPSWVGERGPELLNLPRGSQVIPNHRLRAGGGGTIVVPVYLDGRQIAEAVFDPMRNKAAAFQRQNGRAAF